MEKRNKYFICGLGNFQAKNQYTQKLHKNPLELTEKEVETISRYLIGVTDLVREDQLCAD